MNNLKLTVEKATASTNGGFILTLANKVSVETPFGPKEQSITHYMKVAELAAGVQVGYSATLDLDKFDIVLRDFIPETGDNAGQVIPCKWLQLKPAA
jgi:hypothetical protein